MFSSMTYNTCRDSWNYQHYNENTEQSHHPKISLMLSLYSNKLPTSKIWQLPLYFQSLPFYLIENVTSTNRTVCNLLRLASFPQNTIFKIHPCWVSIVCSFLSLASIPSYRQTAVCLSIYPLKNTWILPSFGDYEWSFYKHLCSDFCVNIHFCFSSVSTQELNCWDIWQIYI